MIPTSYPSDTGVHTPTTRKPSGVGSPPSDHVWSTERRLLEKTPPCAPRKGNRKRSHDRLLLPSSTIDEDDETPAVSLSFRPSPRYASNVTDPTTVILPPSPVPWYDTNSWEDEDDAVVSPRLFYGRTTLVSLDVAMVDDDASDTIFRPREDGVEQGRCPYAPTLRSAEEDRD